jgi:PhnB protein
MKSLLQFSFSLDKENNKILVTREFNAPLPLVWSAWTDPKLLDQWWAPKPFKAKTKSMDFTPGGSWLYSMVGPNNEEHFCRADFKTIAPQQQFTGVDAFTDADGNVNKDFPLAYWNVTFAKKDESTVVNITLSYDKPEDLEKYLELGFKEGFSAALENLDELLEAKK